MQHTIPFKNHQLTAYTEGSGLPIIFLHGWPTNSRLWHDQVVSLKSDYQTITFDWLGFGRSDCPVAFQYSFAEQVQQLDAVIDRLIVPHQKLTLVAHDIGGPPAILWAQAHPERMERLVLLNTVLYTLKTPLDAVSELLLKLPITKDLFVSPFGLRQVLRTNTKSQDPALRSRIDRILHWHGEVPASVRRKTISEPMHLGRQHELKTLHRVLRELPLPIHLVVAKQDPLCYAHMRRFVTENPEVPVSYLERCGHYLAIDQPEALIEELKQILAEQ